MSVCNQCKVLYNKVKSWQKFCTKKCKEKCHSNKDSYKQWSKQYTKKYKNTPMAKYHVHKQGAIRRGIDFNLSFDEWWGIWEYYWEYRGKGKNKLVMCRVKDEGPYEIGNIFIDTYSNNSSFSAKNNPSKRDEKTGRFICGNN